MAAVRISAVFFAAALAAASPAAQQPELRTEFEQAMGRQTRAAAVPPELRSIVREASRERIAVRRIRGEDVVIDLTDREAEALAPFGGGRFVGFPYEGYEYFGFTLVDRAAAGDAALIHTGARPVFSADGRYFASVAMTEAAFGDMEGLSVWEVLPDRVARRFYSDALPRGIDWRIEGWPRADCVAMSAIDYGGEPPAGLDYATALRSAPRSQYQVELDGDGASLTAIFVAAVCGVVPSE